MLSEIVQEMKQGVIFGNSRICFQQPFTQKNLTYDIAYPPNPTSVLPGVLVSFHLQVEGIAPEACASFPGGIPSRTLGMA